MPCNLFRCFHTLCEKLQMSERQMDVLHLTLPLTPVSPSTIHESAQLMVPTSSKPMCINYCIISRTYAHIRTHTHTHTRTNTQTYRHTLIHAQAQIPTIKCRPPFPPPYHAYIHTHIQAQRATHAHAHIHTYTRTKTHISTRTHTHTLPLPRASGRRMPSTASSSCT
jgi:hypothetical protein